MYTLGIDIGSTTSKAVILEDGQKIVAHVVVPLGTGTAGGKDCLGSVTVFIMIGIIVGDNLRIVGRILKVCKQLMRQIVRV